MSSRRVALAILAAWVAVLVLAAVAHSSRPDIDRAVSAIRHEFGTGLTFQCMVRVAGRETGGTYDPRSVNWRDHHSDGSRGSFGLFQIGAVHRSRGESVGSFAARMFIPRENARLARRLYLERGLQPWGGRCG